MNYKVQWIWGILISLFLFCSGVSITKLWSEYRFSAQFPEKEIFLKGYIGKSPVEKANSYQTIFVIKNGGFKNEKLLAYLAKDSSFLMLKAGDCFKVKTRVTEIKDLGNPGGFNYKKYMLNKGIRYSCYINFSDFVLLNKKVQNPFTISDNFRKRLLAIFEKHIEDEEALSVVTALTLGYKEDLTPETKKVFADSGAQHILAVSGLHVGIIYLIVTFITFPLKKINLFSQILVVIIVLWGYAFITGLSPSVVRAAAMFSFFALGKPFQRNVDGFNILALVALLILLMNPLQIYNISFQLSFLAMAGLLIFYPKIYQLYEFRSGSL